MNSEYRLASETEIKAAQLEILKSFDEFCQSNNLKYMLMYGSLLGAIRHHGYIPWDDDIDICMLRDDYDILIRIFGNERLVIKNQIKDPKFPFYYSKICLKETHAFEQIDGNKYDVGISIDLFPLDNYPEKKWSQQKFQRKINKYKFKLIAHTVDRNEIHSFFKRIILKIMNLIFCKNANEYYSELLKYVDRNAPKSSSLVYEVMSPYGKRAIMKKEWFMYTIRIPFESIIVSAPKQYHEILSHIYGDYMMLPPKDEQKTHHSCIAYIKE